MNRLLSLLFLLVLSHASFGQGYKEKLGRLCKDGDEKGWLEILEKWELESPKDPELFTSYSNHYFLKLRQEIVPMLQDEPQG